jgi:hypothetical protein
MGKQWRDCIVTLIDLIGIKKLSASGAGSDLMQRLHLLVAQESSKLNSVDHIYVWNDSVLLLSYVNHRAASFQTAMRDADRLKRRIDTLGKSYAIAVKGQTFPQRHETSTDGLTVIGALSWALANCFEIERTLSSRLRKPWYLDSWIKEKIQTRVHCHKEPVLLLPLNRGRAVYVFDSYLFD